MNSCIFSHSDAEEEVSTIDRLYCAGNAKWRCKPVFIQQGRGKFEQFLTIFLWFFLKFMSIFRSNTVWREMVIRAVLLQFAVEKTMNCLHAAMIAGLSSGAWNPLHRLHHGNLAVKSHRASFIWPIQIVWWWLVDNYTSVQLKIRKWTKHSRVTPPTSQCSSML